jgi:integrase
VDFSDNTVTIRPEVSKTKQRRFVELSQNAVEWLRAYQFRGGSTAGSIVTREEDAFYEHRKQNRERSGVKHWPNSGMRHTFASCWLAHNEDINKLCLLTGHMHVNTLFRHYNKTTTKAEAAKFWSIVPPAQPANVVPDDLSRVRI